MDRRAQLQVLLPALGVVLTSSLLALRHQDDASDFGFGLAVGVFAGMSILALVRWKRNSC